MQGLRVVLPHTDALFVSICQPILGADVSLGRRATQPGHRSSRVLRDTIAVEVAQREIELSDGVALPGGPSIPERGLGMVLPDTLPLVQTVTEIALHSSSPCSAALRNQNTAFLRLRGTPSPLR